MLYVAKVLARALREKFPHVAEKDVLKVIGNLIYYRYINPTIVSPDAFDIISVSPTQVPTDGSNFSLHEGIAEHLHGTKKLHSLSPSLEIKFDK